MNRTIRMVAVLFAILTALLPALRAQIVLADIRGDYATTGFPLSDSFGTGSWTYYASTTLNPSSGTLTQLSFTSASNFGNHGNSGYANTGHTDSGFLVPAVANVPIFIDGATPNASQLAWHPANSSPSFVTLRWTAGTGEAGVLQVAGAFSRVGEPSGSVDFAIFADGVQIFSSLGVGTGNTIPFNLTSVSITAGQSVDFVLGPNGGFGADESLISGTISSTVPEPATGAAICGTIVLLTVGARVFLRRRKDDRHVTPATA
jgi:hypothetical protein